MISDLTIETCIVVWFFCVKAGELKSFHQQVDVGRGENRMSIVC